jgi:hypothetical protein
MIYKWQLEPNLKWFEPELEAQNEFNEHRDVQLATTVWSDSCSSWFKAGKADGKIIALHPGSRTHFMTLLKNPRMQDYHFEYEGNRFAFCGNGLTTRETEEQDLAWCVSACRTFVFSNSGILLGIWTQKMTITALNCKFEAHLLQCITVGHGRIARVMSRIEPGVSQVNH